MYVKANYKQIKKINHTSINSAVQNFLIAIKKVSL